MEPENSLPYFKDNDSCPHPEQDQSSPHPAILFLIFIVILFFHLNLGPPYDLLSSFQAKSRYTFLFCPMRSTRTSHGIFLGLMTPVIVRGDNYEAFHCAIFAIPPVTSSLLSQRPYTSENNVASYSLLLYSPMSVSSSS